MTRAQRDLGATRGGVARARVAAAVGAIAVAVAGCVPASHYHEPRLAPGGTHAPDVDATTAALVGDWAGHFDAPVYARRGDLHVSLRRVTRVVDGLAVGAIAGTATLAGAPAAVDSARVARGRVVLWLAPFADRESGATVWLRLDGALAADTLGGRLRGNGAATTAAERHGGWRVVRVASVAPHSARRAP